MAGQATKPYKSTLSGSIGAGMSSEFNPRRPGFKSKLYHKRGKLHVLQGSDKIIHDSILYTHYVGTSIYFTQW